MGSDCLSSSLLTICYFARNPNPGMREMNKSKSSTSGKNIRNTNHNEKRL